MLIKTYRPGRFAEKSLEVDIPPFPWLLLNLGEPTHPL
jgi:hypothetical protein